MHRRARTVRILLFQLLLCAIGCGAKETACDPRYGDLLCPAGEVCDAVAKQCLRGRPCTSDSNCTAGFACDTSRSICYGNCGRDYLDTFITCPNCCQASYTCRAGTLTCAPR